MNRFIKRIFMSFLMVSISLGFVLQVTASKNDPINFQISKVGEDFIEIDWSNLEGESFILKDQENILYEGNKTSFFKGDLKAGTLVQYYLSTFDKNEKLIDTYELTTYTDFNDDGVPNYSVISNNSTVHLNWTDIKDAIKYNVYLNDELLTETTQSEFIKSDLPSGKSYDFKIVVYLPNTDEIPEEELNKPLSRTYQNDFITLNLNASTTFDIENINKKDFIQEYTTVSTFSDSANSTKLSPTVAGTTATTIRIRTFIAEACYGAWIPGSGEGDGRGPSATSGTHRTLVDVTAYFNPNAYTKSNNNGESVSYSKNGCKSADESGRQTATAAPTVTHTPQSGYATINVRHSIGAPFYGGILPNIDYDFTIKVYSSGATAISGKHDGFPDYEVYKTSSLSSGWSRIYYWDASANGQTINSLNPPMEIDI